MTARRLTGTGAWVLAAIVLLAGCSDNAAGKARVQTPPVPVTVGGMGVLEGSIVYLFSSVGMPVETCVSMVVCQRVMRMAAFLPGGAIYALDGMSPARLPT